MAYLRLIHTCHAVPLPRNCRAVYNADYCRENRFGYGSSRGNTLRVFLVYS
jgi:hypothetical protein